MTWASRAKDIATRAHKGQFYGTGEPYIVHPSQVASLATRLGYGDEVLAGCYLHDVIEDTPVTEAQLRKVFPPYVIDGVLAVTYTGSDYQQKLKQAMSHPLGHVIKFCDASANYANTVLHGAKPGKSEKEVIPRRAAYIGILLKDLPSPEAIENFLAWQRTDTSSSVIIE